MIKNVLASAFFTALGNGLISALISFLRTLLFQVAAVLLLPQWLGIDGIWLAITAALGRIALCHDMVSQFNLCKRRHGDSAYTHKKQTFLKQVFKFRKVPGAVVVADNRGAAHGISDEDSHKNKGDIHDHPIGSDTLGLIITVAAGLTNIILEFLFVGVLQWEIAGAGIATAISQIVGGLFPLGNDGAAAGSQHESHGAEQHGEGHDQVYRGKSGFSRKVGDKKTVPNRCFSLIVLTTIVSGLLLSLLGFFMMPAIARLFE